ncbi:MAG: shikimate dehydrogenase family protein [Anaerolineae bacterium]
MDLRADDGPAFYFIGVTTKGSSIVRLFPLWAKELGRADVRIRGVDLPLHAPASAYRQVVDHIKREPLALGALVTTHKIDVLAAARDLFDCLDPLAELCAEVSSISKNEGRLEGHAKDPLSAGATLQEMLGPGYFGRTGGHVLCFGCGGAAVAVVLHFLRRPNPADRPARLTVVNRSQPRLDALRDMLRHAGGEMQVATVLNSDPLGNDALMTELPPGSMVVNATGMGKDRPGSPISDAALFPERGVAWEMNYRGELGFLHQAERQQTTRRLRVEDGWQYFLHGWTQVIGQVLHVDMDGDRFARLAELAAPFRPRQR